MNYLIASQGAGPDLAIPRAPSSLVLPGRAPVAAAFDQVITLLELLLPEVAGHHRSAVSIHATGEVLAGEADACPLPVLQLTLINKIPFLHAQSTQ